MKNKMSTGARILFGITFFLTLLLMGTLIRGAERHQPGARGVTHKNGSGRFEMYSKHQSAPSARAGRGKHMRVMPRLKHRRKQ